LDCNTTNTSRDTTAANLLLLELQDTYNDDTMIPVTGLKDHAPIEWIRLASYRSHLYVTAFQLVFRTHGVPEAWTCAHDRFEAYRWR